MKYYINGLSSEDIIKTYKIKRQKDGKYKLYITFLDEAAEKNRIKYNLSKEEALEYQTLLNSTMMRQLELFILLPNNLKESKEIDNFLDIHKALLVLSFIVIAFVHQNRLDKLLIDTFLFGAFYGLSIYYTDVIKLGSNFEYKDDLKKYSFYFKNYEQFSNLGIYPNMIDYKSQKELELALINASNYSKVKVNTLNPNLK